MGEGRGRDASEGKGPQRRPQRSLDRRLEEVAKAVGGGYCRLKMPLKLAVGVRGTVARHRLGALEGGGGLRNVTGGRNHDSTATVRKSLRCYVQDAYIYEWKVDSYLYGPEAENQNITI